MLRKITIGVAVAAVVITVLGFAMAAFTYATVPLANTDSTHFDTIIVLGFPANEDGSASADQRARVVEGISEYRRGVAAHIIMTGGAAHNNFVEARVMDAYAQSQGVPAEAIIEEPQAQNTIQNAYFSEQIMEQHGWRSAEVVSSRAHIHRAALIFARSPITWRVHPAPWPPESSALRIAVMYWAEITKILYIRVFGFTPSRVLPQRAH